ncbi:MAG: hypothetical protein Kow00128_22540 [Deltaproteobacteria bacterium]
MSGEREVSLRKEIVSRVLSYEGGEAEFFAEWEEKDAALKEAVREARRNLPAVRVPDEVLHAVVEAVAELGVAGHRGDITILKSARALAALRGLDAPDEPCLADALRMSLPHRLKEDPFEEASSGQRRLDEVLARFGVAKPSRPSGPSRPAGI